MLKDNNKKRHIVIVGKGGGGGIDQVQSDWNQTDNTQVDYIKNKPTVYNEWFGTKAEYDLISPKDPNTIYYIEGNYDLENLSATANGTYQSSTKYGYDEVTVNVQPILQDKTVTTNGSVTADQGYNGLDTVTVNVQPNLTTLNATTNGTYTPTSPVQGYSEVTVNVTTPEEPFYVEDISGLPNTLSIRMVDATCPTIEVYKSTDATNWTSMGTTAVGTPLTASIAPFGKLYLKATANKWSGTEWEAADVIECSGWFGVGGNIMSLLVGDNYENATLSDSNVDAFKFLFADTSDNKLIEAGKLKFPSNTVSGCYNRMFCYCNLNTVPELPATTLAPDCYQGMFQYSGTKASPVLPAETLASGCYAYMFYGTNVIGVVTYAQDISAPECLNGWLEAVSGTGDFYNLGGATYTADSSSGIPSGWTEHNSL